MKRTRKMQHRKISRQAMMTIIVIVPESSPELLPLPVGDCVGLGTVGLGTMKLELGTGGRK